VSIFCQNNIHIINHDESNNLLFVVLGIEAFDCFRLELEEICSYRSNWEEIPGITTTKSCAASAETIALQ
jgi:hypothetical protein